LQEKVREAMRKKLPRTAPANPDDTTVVVSMRSKRNLVKTFDGLAIEWPIIERQMVEWGYLVQAGKTLRLEISFNFSQPESNANLGSRKQGKRGRSATQRLLAEREALLDAEEAATGEPSIWERVYSATRCPGPPCANGDKYCWRDPTDGKHYSLKTHHFREIISHVKDGGTFRTHEDMPGRIRDQLYAEKEHSSKRQKRNAGPSPLSGAVNVDKREPHKWPTPLGIAGPRDGAVMEYCDWQCSQVRRDELKKEFQKARDASLDDGLDLEQVSEQDPSFFIDKGVKIGIARRFVWDIKTWVGEVGTEQLGSM
jgi:hypothetical protein